MSTPKVDFVVVLEPFRTIIGKNPSARIIAESSDGSATFHEACVYHPPSKNLFVTSNQLPTSSTPWGKQVKLFSIHVGESPNNQASVTDFTPPTLANSFLNGGVNYHNDTLLMCAQGSPDSNDLSGLIIVSTSDPTNVKPLVTTFHNIPFNSVNDVVVHPTDGTVWFTDPCYGHHQGIRQAPQLPNQVYCYNPQTDTIRAVADGFTRPNGICFSPDLNVVYVTDTGAIHGSSAVAIDLAGPSHIYAFDLVDGFLANKRLFAYAPGRFPDGIKCDTEGNVYSGCGDGVNVWNARGDLIGLIKVSGGVANFCFGEQGTMFLCNESRLWEVRLDKHVVRGALLGM